MRFEWWASSFEMSAAPAPQDKETDWRLRGLLLGGRQIGENAHDVVFLHDQQFLTIDLDLGARPFAEQHAVANLEVDRDQLAGFVAATWPPGGDFPLPPLFLATLPNIYTPS